LNSTKVFSFPGLLLFFLSVLIYPISAETPFDDEDEDLYFFETSGIVIEAPRISESRSLDDIFPGFTPSQKNRIMSNLGLRHSFERGGSPAFTPAPNSGIELYSGVMRKNPSHIIEAIVVVPFNTRELDMLDIYNALGRIGNLKDQKITLRNGNEFSVFTDTTRLISAQNRRAIPDPPPSNRLPFSETMFLRFTDAHIGDIFIRGDMSLSFYGLNYNMTNFRDINYTIFRIMRAERVSINLYLEPVKEGILIYSVSGIYLPDFIMNRINLTPNINNRINSILNWIIEGLRLQESILIERVNFPSNENIIQNERFNRLLHN
jgi:hypothetical protein